MPSLTYATRKSPLALAQCRAFIATLTAANAGLTTTELLVTTTGDRIQDRPLSEVGGKGLFVKEIEEALLESRADLAVHSVKDVPASLPPGLVLACLPERADPRDVLVAPRHGLFETPGTSGCSMGLGHFHQREFSHSKDLAALRLAFLKIGTWGFGAWIFMPCSLILLRHEAGHANLAHCKSHASSRTAHARFPFASSCQRGIPTCDHSMLTSI